ncbi:bifunctional pyr operon transcriptional regulator/uracil phosphoribosyltransferase PyrR [Megalodesulfovibrio paquesii]
MSACHDLMLAQDIAVALERMAREVMARHDGCSDLAIIGIQRRGADLAVRLKQLLDARMPCPTPLGKLDINLYRDDWTTLNVQPTISDTDISFDIDGRAVVLVDDVLYTGRTVRAGMEALLDFGRPRKIELLTLVDRGHRELPIQPDYLGLAVQTKRKQHVNVLLTERDGEDRVCLAEQ